MWTQKAARGPRGPWEVKRRLGLGFERTSGGPDPKTLKPSTCFVQLDTKGRLPWAFGTIREAYVTCFEL
jgi:hypothetical protein